MERPEENKDVDLERQPDEPNGIYADRIARLLQETHLQVLRARTRLEEMEADNREDTGPLKVQLVQFEAREQAVRAIWEPIFLSRFKKPEEK